MSYSVFVPHDQHVEARWTTPVGVRADAHAAMAAMDWPDVDALSSAWIAMDAAVLLAEAGFAGPAFHLCVNGNLAAGAPESGALGGVGACNIRFETRRDPDALHRDAEIASLRARLATLEAKGSDQVGQSQAILGEDVQELGPDQ